MLGVLIFQEGERAEAEHHFREAIKYDPEEVTALVSLGIIDGTVGSFFEGGEIHTMIGAGWVLVLSSMVLTGKKMTNDIMSVVIALVGVYLAYTVNVMLGMVVVAYLTTLGK